MIKITESQNKLSWKGPQRSLRQNRQKKAHVIILLTHCYSIHLNPKNSNDVCREMRVQWTAKPTGQQLQWFKTQMNSGINLIMQHDWQIAYLKTWLPQYWTRSKEGTVPVRYAVKLPIWATEFTLYIKTWLLKKALEMLIWVIQLSQ